MGVKTPSKAPFKVQYMSDLHLERIKYDWDTTQAAPILILAGDIGRFCDYEAYSDFLLKQCNKYDRVLLIGGNHEFYGSSREGGLEAATNLSSDARFDNKLTFMHRTRTDFPEQNVTILGCTLQSHIAPDYTRLTQTILNESKTDIAWLEQSIREVSEQDPTRRIIVATHYAPAYEKTCHPQNERNAVSQCFSSDTLKALSHWKGSEQVVHWIFGHTHWNTAFKHGKTKVVSNQMCNDSKNLSWLQQRLVYRNFDETAILQV